MFRALKKSLDLVRLLVPVMDILEKKDRDLASQIRRAATSLPLNLAEGNGREGRDRIRCFRIARGSAEEVRWAVRVAMAWQLVHEEATSQILQVADDLCRMTRGLVR